MRCRRKKRVTASLTVPFREEPLTRIGVALEVWEAIAEFTDSDFWRDFRGAIDAHLAMDKQNSDG